MTAKDETERRQEIRRLARQRARERRDVLARRVDVLDDVTGVRATTLPPRPALGDVAEFLAIDCGPLTTVVRHYSDELRRDGWLPEHSDRPGHDLWTDAAVVRAALLLDVAVGCESEVAARIRYHLGVERLPLVYEVTDRRLAQCARLWEQAMTTVGDVHGDEGRDEIWRTLQETPRYELQALVIALAAMVPDDAPDRGRYLTDTAGSRDRGLALLVPRPSKFLQRRRRAGRRSGPADQPGGFAVTAER